MNVKTRHEDFINTIFWQKGANRPIIRRGRPAYFDCDVNPSTVIF